MPVSERAPYAHLGHANQHALGRLDRVHPAGLLALLVGLAAFALPAVAAPVLDGQLATIARTLALDESQAGSFAQTPDGMVSMFVQGDLDEAQIQGLGGAAGSADAPYRTVRIPAAQLAKFLQLKGLRFAQLARATEYQTIASVPSTGASALWGGSHGSYTGLTGKGVIVGIVDTGIDLKHQDFKNPDGTTRLLYLWDQTKNSTPPAPFTYGTEWSAAQINAGQCTESDGIGHGTFMAGVAAGNGRATGGGQPNYQYVGMAPEADIIVVSAFAADTYLVDGIEYILRKAQALQKPAVILIASGVRQGPHDGTDPAELRISSLLGTYGPNRLVVAAAGNYGNVPIHAQVTVQHSTTNTVTVRVPAGVVLNGSVYAKLDGWYPGSHSYSVSVVTPGGVTVGPAAKGATVDIQAVEAHVTILNGTTVSSKGDPNVYISLVPGTSMALAPGAYTVKLTTNDTTPGVADFWLGDYSLNSLVPAFEQGLTFNDTVITPATADSVISVGGFTFRNTWTAAGNQIYGLSGFPTVGDIAVWSARGLGRDGRLIPDLAAPGQAIGAARSSWTSVSGIFILPDSVHMIQTGTSVAAAHVAGALALELQSYKKSNANLCVNGARKLLRSSAVKDAFFYLALGDTSRVWGAGKLHLNGSGQVGVEDLLSLGVRFAPPSPNPSHGGATYFTFELAAPEIADGAGVRLDIIDVAGRIVKRIPAASVVGSQTVSWNGQDDHGSTVRPGIYFAQLHAGRFEAVRKIVRLAS